MMRRGRGRAAFEPARLAIAALERISAVLLQCGREERLAKGASPQQIAESERLFGGELPPSYAATLRVASGIGEPEALLDPEGIAEAQLRLEKALGVESTGRYFPFCAAAEALLCFDRGGKPRGYRSAPPSTDGELPVVEIEGPVVKTKAHNFGEWLDEVADAREASMEAAARLPARLLDLLAALGFRFDTPLIGRLETSDVAAVEQLLGPERTRAVRGHLDRLFGPKGHAELALHLDDLSLVAGLRDGVTVFEAEDVFRWLRTFRNENFFAARPSPVAPPDLARDLRLAAREAPLVVKGVTELPAAAASKYTFRAAGGLSARDFHLLGRTSTQGRSPSLLLHVVDGEIKTAHGHDEPLSDLHVARDGTLWGLTPTHAVRFIGARVRQYPLARKAPLPGSAARAFWYGIGGAGDRVLVWGNGTLLQFDGDGFTPFEPDAGLDTSESVVSLHPAGKAGIAMLVCGDRMGAVARFDGTSWAEIREDQVIEGVLADMDLWRGTVHVLDRNGSVWREERGATPRPLAWDHRHPAFMTEAGPQRATYSVRAFDGGLLLASDGGVISVRGGQPLFHTARAARDPVRLVRVGPEDRGEKSHLDSGDTGLIALSGPHVWLWKDGSFQVLDMRRW